MQFNFQTVFDKFHDAIRSYRKWTRHRCNLYIISAKFSSPPCLRYNVNVSNRESSQYAQTHKKTIQTNRVQQINDAYALKRGGYTRQGGKRGVRTGVITRLPSLRKSVWRGLSHGLERVFAYSALILDKGSRAIYFATLPPFLGKGENVRMQSEDLRQFTGGARCDVCVRLSWGCQEEFITGRYGE